MQELTEQDINSKFNPAKTDKNPILPCGHTVKFKAGGTFEFILVQCPICFKGYKITKEEVEKI